MTAIFAADEPLIERSQSGTVHVSHDDGETWIRFRTAEHYNRVREAMDREQVAHDLAALERFGRERDAYQQRVRDLRDELRAEAG